MSIASSPASHRRHRYRRLAAFGLGAALLLPLPPTAAAETSTTLQDYVVTGTRTPHLIDETPVETLVISREDIERAPVASLPQLLRTLPGISAALLDDNLASDNLRLTMRGLQLHDGYGLILIDGRRSHSGLGGHGEYGVSLNQLPLSMIERIEVVRGGSSALYGADAMAGVINIITRPVPKQAEGTAAINYGTYKVMARDGQSVNSPDRSQARLHVGGGAPVGENSGFYLNLAHESDEGAGTDAQTARRETVLGKWHTRLNPAWSVDLGVDLAKSRQDTAPGTAARYNRQHDEYRLSAGANYREGLHGWKFSTYHYNNDLETGYAGNQHGYRFGDVGYSQAESVYQFFGDRHWLTMGVEAQRQKIDYTFINYPGGVAGDPVPVKENVDIYSVFVQDEIWLLDERLVVVPGVRYEDHSKFGGELNPKLAASLRTGKSTTWRASVGRSFKSPTMRQLYYGDLYQHGNRFERSNPDLDPETAISYHLSVEQQLLNGALWGSLGLFRTDVKDMVVRAYSGADEPATGLPIHSYYNVDRARVEGLELSFRTQRFQGFGLRGGATLTRTENRETGNELPFTPGYTFSLTPGYQWAGGKTGVEATLIANGRQYRDTANTQEVKSHQVVDLHLWRQLGDQLTASLDLSNIFASHKGDKEFSHRQGRSISAGLSTRF